MFQILALIVLVGSISCEEKSTKKQKRGLLGLGYGASLGHIGPGGLALSGGYGSSSLGKLQVIILVIVCRTLYSLPSGFNWVIHFVKK